MKKLVLIAALSLLSTLAHAATITIKWTLPTTDIQGDAFTADTALTSIRLERGSCSAPGVFGTIQNSSTLAATLTQLQMALSIGTYCFRAFAINSYGESLASNTASVTIKDRKPQTISITTVSMP